MLNGSMNESMNQRMLRLYDARGTHRVARLFAFLRLLRRRLFRKASSSGVPQRSIDLIFIYFSYLQNSRPEHSKLSWLNSVCQQLNLTQRRRISLRSSCSSAELRVGNRTCVGSISSSLELGMNLGGPEFTFVCLLALAQRKFRRHSRRHLRKVQQTDRQSINQSISK